MEEQQYSSKLHTAVSLAGVAPLVGTSPMHPTVMGSIPSQGIWGNTGEATD